MTTQAKLNTDTDTASTLAEQIASFQQELLPNVPQEIMQSLTEEMAKLLESGIAQAAIGVGDHFPAFALPDADKQPKSLSTLLEGGPVVINFYRGAWCPYCNLEMNALQQRLPDIRAAGATLVAISPQTPDFSFDQVTKARLDFDVLSDVGNVLSRKCGLVFTLPERLRPIYQAWQLDIPAHNSDDSYELPIPATYILNQDGSIRYAYVNMDYTQRLEPDVIIEQLNK
jgi:peroxiredoxin